MIYDCDIAQNKMYQGQIRTINKKIATDENRKEISKEKRTQINATINNNNNC
ncbi:MAG: hypothetical protein M3Y25_02065 [Thermoproteota archaeon]|nr:hypothetical protein [Thermoproteota archaeon]